MESAPRLLCAWPDLPDMRSGADRESAGHRHSRLGAGRRLAQELCQTGSRQAGFSVNFRAFSACVAAYAWSIPAPHFPLRLNDE